MPKSNFNQFLDECEDFTTTTDEKMSMRKISFETKPPPCNDECESNQPNQPNQNDIKTLNVFSSNLNARSSSSFSSCSSNVFLSKSANNSRDRFDRFSTNRMNNYTNAAPSRTTITTTTTTNATNVQTNIFKKIGDNNHCFNQIPLETSRPMSATVIEINNETFPSLTSTPVAAATAASSVPKKFKNFKDAICAAAPAPSASPTKQKQARVLPTSAIPPPVVVKRDSEMYAKKILAKTKIISAVYDDDDDDEDGDDENRDFNCNRNSKPMFNYENDSD